MAANFKIEEFTYEFLEETYHNFCAHYEHDSVEVLDAAYDGWLEDQGLLQSFVCDNEHDALEALWDCVNATEGAVSLFYDPRFDGSGSIGVLVFRRR